MIRPSSAIRIPKFNPLMKILNAFPVQKNILKLKEGKNGPCVKFVVHGRTMNVRV